MIFTNSFLHDLVGISVALLAVVIAYFKWSFSYWKRKGLEGPEPSIPFGNTGDIFFGRKTLAENWTDVYFELKSKNCKHGGTYFCTKPIYVPTDIQLVKNILQNDFNHFNGHGFYVNDEDPLTVNVFNLDGPRWKQIRTKLTPTFTSGKIRMMFETLVECSVGLIDILQEFSKANAAVDIKDVVGRYTTDVIGSCAFGIDCNSMKNPQSEFRMYGLKALNEDVRGALLILLHLVLPHSLLRFFRIKVNRPEVTNFFQGMVEETVRYREENNIVRKDFMHLLIQLKNKGTVDDDNFDDNVEEGKLTLKEITAQSFIFFVGGFETSSTAMTFTAYELAVNPDIQDKLREEINTVLAKHENKLTYFAIMEMTYLEKVICESLRKHPPLPVLPRVCNKKYTVPDTNLVIEEGTTVFIPIQGIQHDPEYYPEPEKFDPERFNDENKAKRPPFTWLPFGEGPRMCIGRRFAMLQTKVGVITLLRNFRITLNKKTKSPLVYSKKGIILSSEGGIWIDLQKIQ